jgi:5'-nucleotidase (lipoprotein e(P4) family)
MKKRIIPPAAGLVCCLLLLLAGCSGDQSAVPTGGAGGTEAAAKKGDAEAVLSILYQQQAGEYRALCLQAYNIAKNKVSRSVNMRTDKDSLAVITDLDETALDNSANEAQNFLDSVGYTDKRFADWARAKKAGAVPGSVAFFNFVNGLNAHLKKKIDIFYVSNRDSSLVQVTMDNMALLGFPQLSPRHFLFQTDHKKPSKEGRRQLIEKNHAVILLLGDNLIDLDSTFDSSHKLTEGERRHRVDSLADYFGDKYIVFPNAVYGDWEGALYHYHYPPADTIMQIRRDSLHGYK